VGAPGASIQERQKQGENAELVAAGRAAISDGNADWPRTSIANKPIPCDYWELGAQDRHFVCERCRIIELPHIPVVSLEARERVSYRELTLRGVCRARMAAVAASRKPPSDLSNPLSALAIQ
jgi:hypothetical protein